MPSLPRKLDTNGSVRLFLLLMAAALLLTSCGGSDDPSATAAETVTVTATVTATETVSVSETVTASPQAEEVKTPTNSGVTAFGDTYIYPNNLELTVGEPTEFAPSSDSEYMFANVKKRGEAFMRFPVTIHNKTGAIYDASEFLTNAQTGSREAGEVWDELAGIESSPDLQVLPGKTLKFDIGYGVDKDQDFVLVVSAVWDFDDAIFAS